MSARESAVNQENSTAQNIHDSSDWKHEVHTSANAMVQDINICIFVSWQEKKYLQQLVEDK